MAVPSTQRSPSWKVAWEAPANKERKLSVGLALRATCSSEGVPVRKPSHCFACEFT